LTSQETSAGFCSPNSSYPSSCEHQFFYVEGGMVLVHKGAGIRFSFAVLLIMEEQYAP
jgi:hypothetical protein